MVSKLKNLYIKTQEVFGISNLNRHVVPNQLSPIYSTSDLINKYIKVNTCGSHHVTIEVFKEKTSNNKALQPQPYTMAISHKTSIKEDSKGNVCWSLIGFERDKNNINIACGPSFLAEFIDVKTAIKDLSLANNKVYFTNNML